MVFRKVDHVPTLGGNFVNSQVIFNPARNIAKFTMKTCTISHLNLSMLPHHFTKFVPDLWHTEQPRWATNSSESVRCRCLTLTNWSSSCCKFGVIWTRACAPNLKYLSICFIFLPSLSIQFSLPEMWPNTISFCFHWSSSQFELNTKYLYLFTQWRSQTCTCLLQTLLWSHRASQKYNLTVTGLYQIARSTSLCDLGDVLSPLNAPPPIKLPLYTC